MSQSNFEAEGSDGSKRRRKVDKDEEQDAPGESSERSAAPHTGGSKNNNIIMPINTSFSFLSEYEEVFTQCFRVSLTSENFVLKQLDNNGGVYLQLPYYYIPTDLLQIYLNPSEWLTLKNHKRHVSIVDCQVEFEFDNYRPFYNTQTEDIVVASNTNTPKFGIWRGFKNIKPYLVFVNAATYPTTEVGDLLDTTAQYKALNQRLYGDSVSVNGSSHNLGAVDGIRGLALRPTFWYPNAVNIQNTDQQYHESALNLFKHRDSAFAVQQPGVKWGWRYKPTNGLMFQAKSAMQHGPPIFYDPGAANRPRLFKTEPATVSMGRNSAVTDSWITQTESTADPLSQAQNASWGVQEAAYLYGRIENATTYPLGNAPKIDTPPDIFFGIIPQIQTDGKLLLGNSELEIRTMIKIKVSAGIPLAYNAGTAAWGALSTIPNFATVDTSAPIVRLGYSQSMTGYGPGGLKTLTSGAVFPSLKK